MIFRKGSLLESLIWSQDTVLIKDSTLSTRNYRFSLSLFHIMRTYVSGNVLPCFLTSQRIFRSLQHSQTWAALFLRCLSVFPFELLDVVRWLCPDRPLFRASFPASCLSERWHKIWSANTTSPFISETAFCSMVAPCWSSDGYVFSAKMPASYNSRWLKEGRVRLMDEDEIEVSLVQPYASHARLWNLINEGYPRRARHINSPGLHVYKITRTPTSKSQETHQNFQNIRNP